MIYISPICILFPHCLCCSCFKRRQLSAALSQRIANRYASSLHDFAKREASSELQLLRRAKACFKHQSVLQQRPRARACFNTPGRASTATARQSVLP